MKKQKPKKDKEKPKKKEGELQQEENDKPFNFGGLPERDLKKNLGCG
jgi:hypothetical protein